MRKFREETCHNFLREPLILGVNLLGLLILVFFICILQIFGKTYFAAAFALVGYIILRLQARYGKNGSEEFFIYFLEKYLKPQQSINRKFFPITFYSKDTLDEEELIYQKNILIDELKAIQVNENYFSSIFISKDGSTSFSTETYIDLQKNNLIYSLYKLPNITDPLWLPSQLEKTNSATVHIRIDGIDPLKAKKMVENARRSNAQIQDELSNIDSEVSFEESSLILDGISRGEEELVKISLVITSNELLSLDPNYFYLEKNGPLALDSVLGKRNRTHRSHFVRIKTASDLIPNILDPKEEGIAILKTRRKFPLYFSPLDERLDSLHWLVVGATGAGKSFFTGLVLKRLVEEKADVSLLFIDHNRSFKRLCRKYGKYFEPETLDELKNAFSLNQLNISGSIFGIELSDFLHRDKKKALAFLLESIEFFLRKRASSHTVYIILDECWNFLRDEPLLVQRAFREYRKLNGAVIAITHSLTDFLSTENGQSIFQNAPIRILLRQGEDMLPMQNLLSLNKVELKILRELKQKRGEFSECLLKTPFLSKIGRLYPTKDEFELLRTDNWREK